MKNKNLRTWALLFIMLTIFLFITACGRNRNESDDSDAYNGQDGQTVGTATVTEWVTLSVAASEGEIYFLNTAAERLRREMADVGIGFQMNLQLYPMRSPEDLDYFINSISTRFAAGHGYDLIMHHGTSLPIQALISGGYFADINPLIDSDPHSSRQDYFSHILEALEVDGGLYTFPLAFNFEFIGINASLPAEFINRFAGYSTISMSQLAAIYNDLQYSHPDFENLAVGFGLRHGAALQDLLGGGINWNANTFQPPTEHLTAFLQNMQQTFSGNTRHNTSISADVFTNPRGEAMMGMLAERYVFSSQRFSLDPINAMVDFQNPHFVHYIPLVSEDGRLTIWDTTTTEMYSIGADADGDLAWAFLRHLTAARSESFRGENSLEIPIDRRLFHNQMEIALENALNSPAIMPFIGQHDMFAEADLISEAIQRLEGYLSMPVASLTTRILMPSEVFIPAYTRLLYEGLPAEAVAEELTARVSAWLAYEHEVDYDAELAGQLEEESAQEEVDRTDFPVLTLRVLANDNYEYVIRQAAEALNRAWATQGFPYNFEVEITTYGWYWYERQAVATRVQTMLMAGQGHDIIFSNRFMPYRTFAESGFLTEIYALIDQNPNTQRSDFFENVLEAFEIDGGLYAFPISFGFDWVGINASIPQPFIDRFAQYDRISASAMASIYVDFMTEHWMEFGHLFNSHHIGFIGDAVNSVASSFIDFDTRTASFTNPEFIGFLEDMRAVFDERWADERTRTWNVIPFKDASMLTQASREFLFLHESVNLMPINALFTPVNPIFAHHIPISDEDGRILLRMDDDQFVWATLYFPTAGNSELAWEFTQHIITAFVSPRGLAANRPQGGTRGFGNYSFSVPIRRSSVNGHLTRVFHNALSPQRVNHQQFVNLPGNRDQAIADARARLESYFDEHMTIPLQFPDSIRSQNSQDAYNFLNGIITAQAAAQNIQNRVALWLIE